MDSHALRGGQTHAEQGTCADLTFRSDGAAVHFGDPSGDGKSQTRSSGFARTRGVCAIRTLEDET